MEAKARDAEYEDLRLSAIRKTGGTYEIEIEDRGWLLIDDPGFEPRAGATARCYGRGWGHPVRGLDINGREVYYKTEEQYWADFEADRQRREREHQEHLDARGGVSHDVGTGKYDWRDSMGEISGFGDEYEAACRAMLIGTLDFWDEQDEDFDPKYHGFKDVYGVVLDDNEDAKRLDAAMMNAEIVFGNAERERVGEGASGAMHQAVLSHAFYVRKNGWESYVTHMSERA